MNCLRDSAHNPANEDDDEHKKNKYDSTSEVGMLRGEPGDEDRESIFTGAECEV